MTLQRRIAKLENVTIVQDKPPTQVFTYDEWEAMAEEERERVNKAGGWVIFVTSEAAKQATLKIVEGEGTE